MTGDSDKGLWCVGTRGDFRNRGGGLLNAIGLGSIWQKRGSGQVDSAPGPAPVNLLYTQRIVNHGRKKKGEKRNRKGSRDHPRNHHKKKSKKAATTRGGREAKVALDSSSNTRV